MHDMFTTDRYPLSAILRKYLDPVIYALPSLNTAILPPIPTSKDTITNKE